MITNALEAHHGSEGLLQGRVAAVTGATSGIGAGSGRGRQPLPRSRLPARDDRSSPQRRGRGPVIVYLTGRSPQVNISTLDIVPTRQA
jgi:hypothetical protein